jgi:hypothetical protein
LFVVDDDDNNNNNNTAIIMQLRPITQHSVAITGVKEAEVREGEYVNLAPQEK